VHNILLSTSYSVRRGTTSPPSRCHAHTPFYHVGRRQQPCWLRSR
jgi:hypothetical protein